MPFFLGVFWTSLLRPLLVWLLGTTFLKGLVLTVLAFLFIALLDALWLLFPDDITPAAITQSLLSIPSGVWWVLDIFHFDYGLQMLLSATVIRFLIRRIPLIG